MAPTSPTQPLSAAMMIETIIGCKWTVRLLGILRDGPERPSRLLRACPGLAPKVMHERLRTLLRFGIVYREVRGEKPPLRVEYALTDFGHCLVGVLDEVRRLQAYLDGIESAGER